MGSAWRGGTEIYSTDPTGAILATPRDSFGNPSTGIDLEDIELVVFNPAANVTGTAVSLDGMMTGVVKNVNVFSDLSANATQHIPTGFAVTGGGATSRKFVTALNVYNFSTTGCTFNTTHVVVLNLDCGNVGPALYAEGMSITPADDNEYYGIHVFSVKYGIEVSNNFAEQVIIDSVHFESVTYPMSIDSTHPVLVSWKNVLVPVSGSSNRNFNDYVAVSA